MSINQVQYNKVYYCKYAGKQTAVHFPGNAGKVKKERNDGDSEHSTITRRLIGFPDDMAMNVPTCVMDELVGE